MNIRVTAVAINQTPLDWEGNLTRVKEAIRGAREEEAKLICLPELCLTGYGREDAFLAPDTTRPAWKMLEDLLPETKGLAIAVGLPVFHQRALYNASTVIVDGTLLELVAKKNLAGEGIYYEPRWFKPWPTGEADRYLTPDGSSVPVGDLIFDLGGVRIGFEICEDAWVALPVVSSGLPLAMLWGPLWNLPALARSPH